MDRIHKVLSPLSLDNARLQGQGFKCYIIEQRKSSALNASVVLGRVNVISHFCICVNEVETSLASHIITFMATLVCSIPCPSTHANIDNVEAIFSLFIDNLHRNYKEFASFRSAFNLVTIF